MSKLLNNTGTAQLKNLTIQVSPALHSLIKQTAAEQQVSMKEFVSKIVKLAIAKYTVKKTQED